MVYRQGLSLSEQETIFTRLLKNYRRPIYLRTPQEDFCTECLAGILRSDRDLQCSFINEVLKLSIEPDEFVTIRTQKNYIDDEGERSIIDLEIESENWICFLEMKVTSPESDGQLEKYASLLDKSEKNHRALRYCTLFHDKKETNIHTDFYQFRWKDIAKFFCKKTDNNELIHEFYNFLMEQNMAGNEHFNFQDLIALQNYSELTHKLEEVFGLVKPELEKRFGKVSDGVNSSGQIKNHKRHAIWCSYILGDRLSEIMVCISSSNPEATIGPVLSVHIWVDKTNSEYDKFVKAGDNKGFKIQKSDRGASISYVRPLSEFMQYEDQFIEIHKWVKDCLVKFKEFIDQNPQLDWKLKT